MSSSDNNSVSGSSPARYGAYLGLLVGLLALVYGIQLLFGGGEQQLPFKLAFIIGGGLEALLCALSLKRSRAAWGFALSLNGTATLIFFFGAPKVRDGLDVSLGLGMLPFVAFTVITALLALGASEY